jgi:hypothetical protein
LTKTTRVQLASAMTTPHVPLIVSLTRHAGSEQVEILWPVRCMSTSAAKFPELISLITRTLGNAGLELARLQATNGRHTS